MTFPISSSTSVLATESSAPPVPKPAEYSVTDVFLSFFKEKAKDVAKAVGYLAFWVSKAVPDLPPGVMKLNGVMRDFKNFIAVTEIPEKVNALGGSIKVLGNELASQPSDDNPGTWKKVQTAGLKFFKDIMSFINSATDSIDFAHLFIPMSKEALKWVSGIGSVATLCGAGTGAVEQVQHIRDVHEIDTKRTTFYLLNLARDVSYVAVAVISLTFLVTGTQAIPWMIITCLTSGLAFSIGSYFYEKILDPENKGKNLNPAVVVQNYLAQRNYAERLA